MRNLVYYVATSIDGFIADADGDFSAFPQDPATLRVLFDRYPETCPVHVREAVSWVAGDGHSAAAGQPRDGVHAGPGGSVCVGVAVDDGRSGACAGGGPHVVQRHLLDAEVHVDDVDSAKGCLASYRIEERRRPPETVSTGDLRKDYQPVMRLTLGTDRADDIWVVGGHASHGEPGCGAVAMVHLSSVAPVAVPNHPHRGGPSRRSPGVRWSRGRQPGQRRAAVCQRFRRHNSAVSPVAKLVHAA